MAETPLPKSDNAFLQPQHDGFSARDQLAGGYPPRVMAGLVPAIHVVDAAPMQGGWVYIMTNKPNGTLYTGVTNDISRRAYEHRIGQYPGFTKTYGLTCLVYIERYDDIRAAIQRERNMKHWSRAWKVRLILAANPDWRDLYDDLA